MNKYIPKEEIPKIYCIECGDELIKGKNISHSIYCFIIEADYHKEKTHLEKICNACQKLPKTQERYKQERKREDERINQKVKEVFGVG